MKRTIKIIILTIAALMALAITCCAETVQSPENGFAFILSDNWQDKGNFAYVNKYDHEEFFSISVVKTDDYVIELVDEAKLRILYDERFSNANLANKLSETNNANVSVYSNSVQARYETYAGVRYFRYEKSYTASAPGFYDKPYYLTAFITIRNGRIYEYLYERNYETNNFDDITAMLDSVSYEYGEIKIFIDNQQIHPDSAPVLLNDRTLVPIRAVAEKMGYTVSWDDASQTVNMVSASAGITLRFQIGNTVAIKNSSEMITLDVPALLIGERTYLPLRAVTEAMNATVKWNEGANAVEITSSSLPSKSAAQMVSEYVAANKAVVEKLSNNVAKIELQSRGTAVVYKFTYLGLYNLDASTKALLKEETEKNIDKAYMTDLVKLFRSECPAVTSLIYEYYTADGELVCSAEFN